MFYSLVHGSPSEYCITMTDRLHKKQKELEDFTEERKNNISVLYVDTIYRYIWYLVESGFVEINV